MTTATETRAHLRKVQGNGVRTFEDIRLRCRVDEITGCWLWSLSMSGGETPKAWICPGVFGEKPRTMPAAKASWLLSGRKIEEGHVVWRVACTDARCVNPQHCIALPRAEMRRACGLRGREKGKPERAVQNWKNRASLIAPKEVVREVEKRLGEGKKQSHIAAELPVSTFLVHKIATGKQFHSSVRATPNLRGSSVFTLGLPK